MERFVYVREQTRKKFDGTAAVRPKRNKQIPRFHVVRKIK